MRVLLVGPDLEENLSLRYLSASLVAAGHTATIAPFDTAADEARVRVAARDADLVGLSMCYQVRAPDFLDLARGLRADAPNRPVIAGGHYASCAARALLENHRTIDVVAIHEGEQTIVELANLPALTADALRNVRGIVFRDGETLHATEPRPILGDLDRLAWPDRSGPARLLCGVPTAYLMGSRGCLSNCDYCCITTLHRLAPGKRFRQRRPEAIAEEMAWLYHERGVRQFIFHDDNFLVPSVEKNLDRIDALDRELRSRGVRHVGLVLKCRPADVQRPAFLRLREMGLLRVFLGIESGSAEGLASIGRRQTVEDAHRALQICEELGISTQYTVIMFHPEATPASMIADLEFVRSHLAHPLSFCRAEIYAGTPLEGRMIASSRARGSYLARTYEYTDPRTADAWQVARRVLRDRCFSGDNLMGRGIQLDHLTAVFRQFYDGREVDRLAKEFAQWQLALNRESVELMREVIETVVRLPDPHAPERESWQAAFVERESSSRRVLHERACALREALKEHAFGMIGLPRSKATEPRTGLLSRGPRHAAAVLVAVGVLGCGDDGSYTDDGGVSEAPPADTWREDFGVVEAPPPDTWIVDTNLEETADVSDADGADASDALDGDATKDGSDGG